MNINNNAKLINLLNLSDLSTYKYLASLSSLSSKEKILLLFTDVYSLKEIKHNYEVLYNKEITMPLLSQKVFYKTRDTGLLPEGLIKEVSKDPSKYIITDKGKELLLSYVKKHNESIELQQRIKSKELQLKAELKDLEHFFNNHYREQILEKKRLGKHWIGLDFKKLSEYNSYFGELVLDEPEDSLKKIEIAIESMFDYRNVRARFYNFPNTEDLMLGEIRTRHINQFHSFEGIIKQTSSVKPLTTMIKFECRQCGTIISVLQLEHKIIQPSQCGCKSKNFRIESKEMIDLQVLKVEELPEQLDGRTNAQTVEVLLKHELAKDKFQKYYNPGSRIKFTGIVKERPKVINNNSKSTKSDLIVEANFIELDTRSLNFSVTEEDKIKIKELSKRNDIIDILTDSFIPDLLNLTEEKKGVLLNLVNGGNCKRDKIHVLYAGEPGLAKSDLLTNVDRMFPFSRYASGSSSSSVGLTASVVKDDFTGSWSLNAGAVVMANNGVCCVDEIDKMREEDKNDLNECAEQGTVTINKAQIHGSLKADTGLIIACNPKTHKFNDHDDFITQINLPHALMTRFDLIFIMKNTPEQMSDLFKNILDGTINKEIIEEDLFIKYIMFSRTYDPIITSNAKQIIYNKMNGLITLQKTITDPLPISITPRQLHGMIRLSTAFAKLRLSKKVEECDVNNAWNLFVLTLKRMGFNE